MENKIEEKKVICPFCKRKFVIMSRQWERVPTSHTMGSLLSRERDRLKVANICKKMRQAKRKSRGIK